MDALFVKTVLMCRVVVLYPVCVKTVFCAVIVFYVSRLFSRPLGWLLYSCFSFVSVFCLLWKSRRHRHAAQFNSFKVCSGQLFLSPCNTLPLPCVAPPPSHSLEFSFIYSCYFFNLFCLLLRRWGSRCWRWCWSPVTCSISQGRWVGGRGAKIWGVRIYCGGRGGSQRGYSGVYRDEYVLSKYMPQQSPWFLPPMPCAPSPPPAADLDFKKKKIPSKTRETIYPRGRGSFNYCFQCISPVFFSFTGFLFGSCSCCSWFLLLPFLASPRMTGAAS